jgi:predicted transcriptional regulator
MLWAVGFVILLVFLMIPILAIVLDSPVVHRLAESRKAAGLAAGEVEEVKKRLAVLEDEVDDLGRAMQLLKEDTQFIQRLLESAEEKSAPKLPPAS